ncbi:MAG: DUF4743 domain-containing protein [Betaproteobacteria bacterium]
MSLTEGRILPALHARFARTLAQPTVALVPFEVDGMRVGELTEARARRVADFDDVFALGNGRLGFASSLGTYASRTEALERVARTLAAEGALTAWRDERYDIRASAVHPAVAALERAAARYFGIPTRAVHANGLVDMGPTAAMWIARRSATKAIDPGLLDNLVGGGIAAGAGVTDTLVKEAWEEAGIGAALAGQARSTATLQVRRLGPDGVQNETIHVHDLWLPRDFVPANQDGEAVEHRLVLLDALPALLANDEGPDVVTLDASLVALDALMRLGTIDADDPYHPWLAALCGAGR